MTRIADVASNWLPLDVSSAKPNNQGGWRGWLVAFAGRPASYIQKLGSPRADIYLEHRAPGTNAPGLTLFPSIITGKSPLDTLPWRHFRRNPQCGTAFQLG